MSTFNAQTGRSGNAASIDARARGAAAWARRALATGQLEMTVSSADASFRRYFRVRVADASFIVMDAPPEREALDPFVDIAARLRAAGLNAPRVIAADADNGYLLLDDFGDETFLSVMDGREAALYADAIRALVKMQNDVVAEGLPHYGQALLATEMALFYDWLAGRHLGLDWLPVDEREWARTTALLTDAALAQPKVFVHRDYHSRNLMYVADNNPGILDFQDAVQGPVTYDLVSLLRDCYISLPPQMLDSLFADYIVAARGCGLLRGIDGQSLRTAFDLMGVQRHLKASGIFARLFHRDGKKRYLDDIPRTLNYLVDVCADYDDLDWLGQFVERRVLPRFGEVDASRDGPQCAR